MYVYLCMYIYVYVYVVVYEYPLQTRDQLLSANPMFSQSQMR